MAEEKSSAQLLRSRSRKLLNGIPIKSAKNHSLKTIRSLSRRFDWQCLCRPPSITDRKIKNSERGREGGRERERESERERERKSMTSHPSIFESIHQSKANHSTANSSSASSSSSSLSSSSSSLSLMLSWLLSLSWSRRSDSWWQCPCRWRLWLLL